MHEESSDHERIGQILLREGLIETKQLEHALSLQAEQTTYKPLGEILVELGFISRPVLRDVLFKYRKQIKLGELLVRMGVITESQLADALKSQQYGGKRLGQILVDWGYVKRSRLVDALTVQLGVGAVDSLSDRPDDGLLANVNVAFLRRKKALPLGYETTRGTLRVLMEDPTDTETIADIEKIFKAKVEPVMLRTDNVEHLFDELFDVWHWSE